ncbi:MAG: MetQ/NlpA family ABC transporter substrate-binding protein [Acidaminococcaceae bacterium]|nr:MetQ/NlpA family ABC transporter substrate-binding protein [Acidaminococcaceae bacterium]MBR1661787.1 MetQ/NlpA family ABC transporter substrate-binding protein [Acidaminococcaceae bacterium]
MKKIVLLISIFILAISLVGCGGDNKKTEKPAAKEIKIGATAGPHAQVVEAVAKEGKKQGLDIKVIEFSDYITPDKALADGEIDLVSYQHKPFMENFNKQNKSDLVAIGKTILMRMGIYSDKHKDLKNLPENAVIAIPNDPTNGGRGLVLLEKAGLIKLKEGVGFKATAKDVVENPKKFQFKELEAAQLPRSLPDVDAAVITMNYVMSGGLDVQKQGLFWETKDEPLAVMILAVKSKDKDNATYLKIAELFHSEGVRKYIADTFKGTIVPAE